MRFRGYRRNNGSVGVRNLVAVITTTGCINEIPKLISRGIPGAIPLGHNLSCSHLGDDLKRSTWILTNLVGNPNIFGAVLVGMGCEQMSPEKIYQDIQELEKPVELLMLKEVEDWDELVRRGRDALHRISEVASKQQREEAELGEMSLAIKCGGSDTTSGVVSNPVAGFVADRIISEGGTVVFTETPEILGAEHVLAKRAINKAVAERVLAAARNTERRVMEMGVDLRGSEPTPANIAGGLTTIEEKSLGAIIKAGSTALQGVLDYGERPSGRGLFFMDGPARTAELLVGIAAAGCQVMVFSMGGGLPSLLPMLPAAPARFPLMPVIKMSGNPDGHEKRKDLIDIYVGNVIDAGETIEQAGDRLLKELVSVASGQKQTIYERGSYEEPLLIQIDGPSI
jgi:altronate dehydratase large subunit